MFDRLGYNLQITDLQSAVGLAQLGKLSRYDTIRKRNWQLLHDAFYEYKKYFILPSSLPGAEPSWFGFHATIKGTASFTSLDLTKYLESRGIGTRMLFGGNLLLQPAFKGIAHKVFGTLDNSTLITRDTFWIGVHPGIDEQRINYIIKTVHEFMRNK